MTLQFEDSISQDTHLRIKAISHYFDTHTVPGIVEYVPGYTTVTFYYDPWAISEQGKFNPYDQIVERIQQALRQVKLEKASRSEIIEVPVCYGEEFGPDLEFVAQYTTLTPREVIELHSKGIYLVHMIGFAPGFPYLGGLSKKLTTPRKEHPRKVIPQGSVGIAGNQTGVYPIETPGGWQLIGRTPLKLFDPDRTKPSLLQAGDKIRFVPISAAEYERQVKDEH